VCVTFIVFVLLQVPKKKVFFRGLEEPKEQDDKEEQEENNLDKLEKKASSLLKVSTFHHHQRQHSGIHLSGFFRGFLEETNCTTFLCSTLRNVAMATN
jgi:hypothetical protein